MRYRGGHLSRRSQAENSGKLLFRRPQFFLGTLTLGNVNHGSDKHFRSILRRPGYRTMAPYNRPILTSIPFHYRIMLDFSLLELGESDLSDFALFLKGDVQRCEIP